MLPGQGGFNSKAVADMYKTLNAEGKQRYLKIYWYTAKDIKKGLLTLPRNDAIVMVGSL